MNIKSTLQHYWRVLLITKKPDKIEYELIVKVCALGILVVGVIGFALSIAKQLFFHFSL